MILRDNVLTVDSSSITLTGLGKRHFHHHRHVREKCTTNKLNFRRSIGLQVNSPKIYLFG